jgi:flagella basal body P-ring formation protein FlgA
MRVDPMKTIFTCGWILLVLILLGSEPSLSAPPTRIAMNFKTPVSVNHEIICLEDIADLQGSPRFWVEKIGQVKIKASPAPGEMLVLSRQDIARKIAQIHPSSFLAAPQIPDQIEVIREGRTIEQEEVLKMLETGLQKLMNDRNKTIKVTKIRGEERIHVPPGSLSWDVQFPDQAKRGGDITATVIFLVNGREVKKSRIQARVEIYAEVVVARNFLKRNQELGKRDVQLINKNISLLPPDIVTDLKDVLGKQVILSVNSQEILRSSMVEIPPLVKKGDRVILLVENNQFRITTFGEVKEEGRPGDRVKLVNSSSKKEVYGRVLDSNTIQVDF